MKSRILLYGSLFTAGVLCGMLLLHALTTPKTVTVTLPGDTKVVTVDRPVIQTRDVIRQVVDTAESQRLMGEANELKYRISVLSETLAKLQASGGGQIQYIDRPVPGPVTEKDIHFSDWRLTFDISGTPQVAKYLLSQRFEAITAVGKDRTGQPIAVTRMFEVGPGETRTLLTDAKTTVVAATPDAPRWHFRASVTAGAGYAGGLNGLSPGGIVGLRWASYGSSASAEDGRWAIATPAIWLDTKTQQLGLLPVSVNLGQIPRQPFRDIWVSPFVGLQAQPFGLGKVGVVFTATF